MTCRNFPVGFFTKSTVYPKEPTSLLLCSDGYSLLKQHHRQRISRILLTGYIRFLIRVWNLNISLKSSIAFNPYLIPRYRWLPKRTSLWCRSKRSILSWNRAAFTSRRLTFIRSRVLFSTSSATRPLRKMWWQKTVCPNFELTLKTLFNFSPILSNFK